MTAGENVHNIDFTASDGSLDSADNPSTTRHVLTVEPEDASVAFDSVNAVAVAPVSGSGSSGEFSLTVLVKENLPDLATDTARPGDIGKAVVTMTLQPVGPVGSVSGVCTPADVTGAGYRAELSVTCTFDDVPVNTYRAEAVVDGAAATTRFYSGFGEEMLVVYYNSSGFTTGGGWFYWPETADKTNFSYTMEYDKKGNKVKGSLLLIRHSTPGTYGNNYRIKSNALFGLSLRTGENLGEFGWASFSGKCTYREPDVQGTAADYQFVVYVEDHGVPGAGTDRFWLEVRDAHGDLVMDLRISSPTVDSAEVLEQGNIVVSHETQKGKPAP